jgi:sporulation protein YlmC with PRC-barrel domain
MKISDRELRGRAVIAADGRVIGRVSGLTLDSDGLGLGTLEIEVRREAEEALGVEHKVFSASKIEVPFGSVQSIGDTVVLAVPLDALRKTPMPTAQPAPA